MNEANSMIVFPEVTFDDDNQTMTILNGTEGTYDYKDIKECVIANESAKHRGKEKPFAVTVVTSPLPVGLFTERAFYVGLKITLMDGTVLAIYTSKTATRNNTDLHKADTQAAQKIKKVLDRIIKDHNA